MEIYPPEFCPIPGDWGKLGKANLARMSLTKCYWMPGLQLLSFWVLEKFLNLKANALIFNKGCSKTKKYLTLGTILLSFFKNWVGVKLPPLFPLVPIDATTLENVRQNEITRYNLLKLTARAAAHLGFSEGMGPNFTKGANHSKTKKKRI